MKARSILESLIEPISRQEFLDQYWERSCLVAHGAPQRIWDALGLEEAQDLTAFLRPYKSPVMVMGDVPRQETDGLSDRFMVPPDQALEQYRQGGTLELDCVDMYIPELFHAVEKMRSELGLPQGTFSKAIVYASPPGGGLTPHFDSYSNFVLQLRGCKTWHLAPNHNVVAPMDHYALDEPFLPAELRTYWRGAAPTEFLAISDPVELRPGSLLFLPRGWWHATEAADESLSVNFNFSARAWMDLVLAEIRSRLVKLDHWRELADGCDSTEPDRAQSARQRLSSLLARLAEDMGPLGVDEVLARQADPHDGSQIAQAVFRQALKM